MHKYFLIYTACLNVETEVQCTAVPSTLTLWMETKWSNPLLIRNLRWHADVTGIYKRKNIQIILKCNSPTFTIWTEYLYFYTLINSKFQQLPPPLEESMGIWLSSIQEGGGHLNLTWVAWGTSTESASLSIRTNTWFWMPDTYFRSESPMKQFPEFQILTLISSLCIRPSKCSYSATDNNYTLLINCKYVSLNLSVLNCTINHTQQSVRPGPRQCVLYCAVSDQSQRIIWLNVNLFKLFLIILLSCWSFFPD